MAHETYHQIETTWAHTCRRKREKKTHLMSCIVSIAPVCAANETAHRRRDKYCSVCIITLSSSLSSHGRWEKAHKQLWITLTKRQTPSDKRLNVSVRVVHTSCLASQTKNYDFFSPLFRRLILLWWWRRRKMKKNVKTRREGQRTKLKWKIVNKQTRTRNRQIYVSIVYVSVVLT